MTTLYSRGFKLVLMASSGVASLVAPRTTSAQLAFVPKNVTVIAAPGANLGGADTARSAELRSQGQLYQGLGHLYQGQGAFLHGAGNYLQGWGQYQIDMQVVNSMRLDNREKYLAFRRSHMQQLEHDKQRRIIAAKQKNEQSRLARFRDQASTQSVASGESLNFLWECLGSRVESISFRNVVLTEQELAAVRLRCHDGFTIDKLLQTLNSDRQVQWPATLRRDEFSHLRNEIEQSVAKVRELENNGQDARTHYQEAMRQTQSLEKLAGATLAREGAAVWQAAREFCVDLRQTLTMASTGGLARPESILSYQPRNTSELIWHMRHHNLRFAPTTDETATAYRALHAALAVAHQLAASEANLASR